MPYLIDYLKHGPLLCQKLIAPAFWRENSHIGLEKEPTVLQWSPEMF